MADSTSSADLAKRVVTQPGRLIPGIPPFVFIVPEGWVLDEAPGSLAVLRSPVEIDGFWINAMLNHDRVARSVDFKVAAQVTWAKLNRTGMKDIKESGERMLRFGNMPVYVRGADFTAPDGRSLSQMHAIWFAPTSDGGKVVDMFQLVLTAPSKDMPAVVEPILEMISTFRFT